MRGWRPFLNSTTQTTVWLCRYPHKLLPAAQSLAKKIAANAPVAVQLTMEAIERGLEMPQEQGLFLEASLFGMSCATEDMREGTRAFLEKRAPQFQGK